MEYTETFLPEVLHLLPAKYLDYRGSFSELWHQERYQAVGVDVPFVQDNVAESKKGVIRGLHYQYPQEQAKLVTALYGKVFDVAVDIRKSSSTFGQWVGIILSAESRNQLFIPAGFAHGYQVLTETAIVHYKCSTSYDPTGEYQLCWNDPNIGIAWPISKSILSDKDRLAPLLSELIILPP